MNQFNNPSVQQNDFLSVNQPAPAPISGGRNPNIWKPRVDSKTLKYAAIVRVLPQGIEGLKNNSYPSVMVKTHYLKDVTTGVKLTIKCRQTLPDAECPICRDLRTRYNALKDTAGEVEAKAKFKKLWASTEWYTNVLVRRDQNNSANNGKVMMWAHSDAIERKLYDPCIPDTQTPSTDPNAIIGKAKRCFIPYSPRNGVDYVVMAQYDTSKQMPTYDGSYWAETESPLASDDNQMLEILEQCHDLSALLKDVPSEEKATAAITEYWAKVDSALRQSNVAGMAAAQAAPAAQYAAPSQAQAFGAAPNYQMYAQQQQAAPAPAQQANVNTMDAKAFFGAAAQQAPAPSAPAAPAPAPSAPVFDPLAVGGGMPAQSMPQTLPASDDDDDLPF